MEIVSALKNLKASKDAKRSERKYKKEVKKLETTLKDLKTQLASNAVGVDENDIDDLNEILGDMRSDSNIYKAAIALAIVDLASKTTAVITQTATAASSSGTYGFSAGITLDVNGNKRQTNTSSTSSKSSNISTENLAVRTGKENTTSFQGSNITVFNDASIDTGELNLLASQDTYNY